MGCLWVVFCGQIVVDCVVEGGWWIPLVGSSGLKQVLKIFLWKFGMGFVTGNSKGKSEIQGSFDSALRAFAQDDDHLRLVGPLKRNATASARTSATATATATARTKADPLRG